MSMHPRRLAMVAAPAIALMCGHTARAATLVSPPVIVQAGKYVHCLIGNAGTSPIQVTSAVLDSTGTNIGFGDTCPTPPATLAPGATCYALGTNANVVTAYCRFTSTSSRVRGSLVVRDANGEIGPVVPATK